jgi:Tol biopolymer transport system component
MDVGSAWSAADAGAEQPGTMTFAPRFSPDGGTVVFSLERGGNTDIYALDGALGRPDAADQRALDRDRALVQPRWQPDRL